MQPAVATETPCKCCGALAYPYGIVDFHKNCESRRRRCRPFGRLDRYHRCPWCGFVFTTDFDGWTLDDFRLIIYNDSYVLVDPDYREERPRANAATVFNLFPDPRPERRSTTAGARECWPNCSGFGVPPG